eukprot:gene8788-736_t
MTDIISNSSKAPKVKYKNALRDEMMKTFSRFFQSGDSYDDLGTPNISNPGEPVIDLKKHLEQLSQPASCSFDQKDGYDNEFENLTRYENTLQRQTGMFKSARQSKNSKKNKYSKVLPNEKTRVKLQTTEKHEEDYINANLIDLEGVKQKYIATQAPITETFVDFWRMVLEYRCRVIVMLTETDEDTPDECNFLGKSKADRYWPLLGETIIYGHVEIETISQTRVKDINQLEFILRDLNHKNSRRIYFYQYLGWPDMGCPKCSKSLNYIMQQMSRIEKRLGDEMGPTVVHCSAGIGRTGTFIAIHAMLQQMKLNQKQEFNFDIFNTVKQLKQQRVGMIQKKEQYVFTYQTIFEYSKLMGWKFE